jgi:DNA-binding transcriptional regulator YiaG
MQANERQMRELMNCIDIIQEHRFDVAHATGVSVQTLEEWTEGDGGPTMEQADRILEFLRNSVHLTAHQ